MSGQPNWNRRQFTAAVCAGAVWSTEVRSEENIAAAWLERAGLLKFRDISGILSFTRFKDPMYILNSPIKWQPKSGGSHRAVTVPAGFVTDLASIPSIFFSLFRPDGEYAHAAVIHDFLYWEQITTREEADEIFKQAMIDAGVSSIERRLLFEAVATFGEKSWARNEEQKRSGEMRILKEFPTDPRTTWAEWKSRPGVFVPKVPTGRN